MERGYQNDLRMKHRLDSRLQIIINNIHFSPQMKHEHSKITNIHAVFNYTQPLPPHRHIFATGIYPQIYVTSSYQSILWQSLQNLISL